MIQPVQPIDSTRDYDLDGCEAYSKKTGKTVDDDTFSKILDEIVKEGESESLGENRTR